MIEVKPVRLLLAKLMETSTAPPGSVPQFELGGAIEVGQKETWMQLSSPAPPAHVTPLLFMYVLAACLALAVAAPEEAGPGGSTSVPARAPSRAAFVVTWLE